jgi:hypothetical protein
MPTWEIRPKGDQGFEATLKAKHKAVHIWHLKDAHYEAQVQVPGFESGELTDVELVSLVEDLGAHAGAKFEATGTTSIKDPRRPTTKRIYKLSRLTQPSKSP